MPEVKRAKKTIQQVLKPGGGGVGSIVPPRIEGGPCGPEEGMVIGIAGRGSNIHQLQLVFSLSPVSSAAPIFSQAVIHIIS